MRPRLRARPQPSTPPRRPRRCAGLAHSGGSYQTARAFTLIEVLLAVAIFAIVLVAIHMVFYGAVQLRNKTADALQQALPLQQTLTILKRDLENIVLPGGTLFGELQTSTLGTTATNALASLNPVNDSVVGQSSPAFFTASGVLQDDLPWGAVQRVSYYLTAPTNNTPGKDLVRSVTRDLLPSVTEQPELQHLMTGVQSIAFSYYDGLQWREYWDSTVETNKLPQGIKVELQMAGTGSDRSPRTPVQLVVPIVLQAGTNQVAQSSQDGQ
jgi:type II secretion system protein J